MPLTKPQKKEVVEQLSHLVTSHQGGVFVQFGGSDVDTIRSFRSTIRNAGGTYKVVKKSLLAKAVRMHGMDGEYVLQLEGN
ncbi:MAG: 50S ribosomal protein L10, partial [Candidatus Paceibacteria bacterium]